TAEPAPEPEPEPEPTEAPEETAEPEPEPEAETPDSNLLAILLVGAVVLIGGGAGYYFKIYKPKHQAPDLEDDYCEYEEEAPEEVVEDYEETADEDTPPWDEDGKEDRKSTRLNSSHVSISYAVFCLKKKTKYIASYSEQLRNK